MPPAHAGGMNVTGIEPRRGWRTVDVCVSLETPAALRDLTRDVTLSFHSQAISSDSRAVAVPWTNAVRIVGTDDAFVVRMKVPAESPFLLHAVAQIDERDQIGKRPVIRRHIGFTNATVPASGPPKAMIEIRYFESYNLVMPDP